MPKFTDILALIITADSTQAVAGLQKVGVAAEANLAKADLAGNQFEKSVAGIGAVAPVAGVAVAALGVIAAKTALDGEKATARLQVAIANVGQSYQTFAPSVAAASDRMAQFGFNNIDVETSIARLIPATHSVAEAIKLQGLAADIARGRGISLAEATTALVQVEAGRYQALTRAGILSKDQVKGFKDQQDALNALAATYKGEASAFASTFAGQLAELSAQSKNLGQTVGGFLVPVVSHTVGTFEDFIAVGKKTVGVLGEIKDKFNDLASKIPGLKDPFGGGGGGTPSPVADKITQDLKDEKSAQDALTVAVANFGPNSKEAVAAAAAYHDALQRVAVVQNSLDAVQADVTAGLQANKTATEQLTAAKAKLEVDLSQGNTAALAGDYKELTRATLAAAIVTDQMTVAEQRSKDAAEAAALGIGALGAAFVQFSHDATVVQDKIKIADAFDAVNTAADKVKGDQADIAGTSQAAADARRGERDALRSLADANQAVTDSHQRLSDSYVTLQDAQDRVKTSVDGLLRAQQALDQYNSPRGAQERALQLDQIQRTVATTPAQEDAKQLALLQFQDRNSQQQQSLQDAVTNAARGVRDANRSVLDAQKGIADAERGIQDATVKVADAQQTVSDAVKKRQAIHDDAAAAIAGDERKVESAIAAVVTEIERAQKAHELANGELGNYLTLLDDVGKVADPGGPLSKALDSLIGKMQLSAVLAQAAIDKANTQPTPNASDIGRRLGPISFATPTVTTGVPAPHATASSVTFANTYHINAQGNPTQAELDYIARSEAWQLTSSGRY